ncbi:ATP-binding cassette domain-containing protein [Pseudoroseomonas globiformis]|uniref:ATP-binding cassette domain-containing protein n=1 Tax=Teichococcus globiformis TaxID=2307229 RepID=A0ABV7G348_9PROT
MTVVALEGINLSYRGGGLFSRHPPRTVLRDAALRINEGECVALLGRTGSGKSTLGRILLGLERPDAGTASFRGAPLLNGRGRMIPATRRALQAVFQDPYGATSQRHTAFDVVAEPLLQDGLPRAMLRDRVAALMHQVELDPAPMDRLAHRMSGGQLQRLCIARALAPCPALIVLDEAVNSLDAETQAHLMVLLRRLRQDGMAFLFITHDLRLLRGFADRVCVMQDGRPLPVPPPGSGMPEPAALAELRAALLPARPPVRDGARREAHAIA